VHCKFILFFVKSFRDLLIYPETCKTIQILVKQHKVLIIIPSYVKLFRTVKLFKDF